jgi:4'-phosphopantetheinyl transferase EntD
VGKLGAPPLAIGRTDTRQPRWPEGAVGSITHSHEHAVAAAALRQHYRGLGVDLERQRLPSDALLERVARPAELAVLRPLDPAQRSIAFTALFAAKESVYKAVNPITGIYLGFMDAEITFATPVDWGVGGAFTWCLVNANNTELSVGGGAWRRQGEWAIAGVWIPVR